MARTRCANETYRPADMMEIVDYDRVKLKLGIFIGNLCDVKRRMRTFSASGVFGWRGTT